MTVGYGEIYIGIYFSTLALWDEGGAVTMIRARFWPRPACCRQWSVET